jgi:YHYH protein
MKSKGIFMMKRAAFLVSFIIGCVMTVTSAHAQVDLSLFGKDAIVKTPELVDCTLSTGAAAKCAEIAVKYKPDSLEIGPFCPATLNDTGGIWNWDGDKPGLYRLNRAFFEMLKGMGYTFYDDDEKVHISDPGAGKPAYDNACLRAADDTAVQMTILIPNAPVKADKVTDLGTVASVGVALDGVPIFADAPSVLDTGHLPALDTCGGHIDPGGWYHWHGTATDIDAVYKKSALDAHCGLAQAANAQFGYAFDGYAMFGTADADGSMPSDLDSCRGHTGPTAAHTEGEYHYHATADFPNLPKCLTGVQAENNFKTTAKSGIGSSRRWWWPF